MSSKYPDHYSLRKIKLMKDRGQLINPAVQRDLVWTLSQKRLLIDSLIKDFDIPKIYLREIGGQDSDNNKTYNVVDGQQRINAITSFMEDVFDLPSDADKVGGEFLANKKYSDFSTDLQVEFDNRSLDVVILQDYTDEQMEETFLRLQNGTPLKAPEKRRAIPGNMRNVVADLAGHNVFDKYCDFENTHFAYEDVVAKMLIQKIHGGPTSISAQALKRMYEVYSDIDSNDKAVKEIKSALNYIESAFKNQPNPKFKKYSITDLTLIVSDFINTYDIQQHKDDFSQAYLSFLDERATNAELPEEKQDPLLISYSNCARADSLESLTFRQRVLREYLIEHIPNLATKDTRRFFTSDQKAVLFRLSNGVCAACGKPITDDDFEADHIIPHSKGGLTKISNGQALCSECNKKKSDS